MELSVDELGKKAEALRQELSTYAQSIQDNINKLQQDLQDKVREAQRAVDQKQGQITALEDLIREMNVSSITPEPENN